jgi:hypothetical protein
MSGFLMRIVEGSLRTIGPAPAAEPAIEDGAPEVDDFVAAAPDETPVAAALPERVPAEVRSVDVGASSDASAPPPRHERSAPVAEHPRPQPEAFARTPVFGSVPRSPAVDAPPQQTPGSAGFAPGGLRHAVIESVATDRTARDSSLPPTPMRAVALDAVSVAAIGDAHAGVLGHPPRRPEEPPAALRPADWPPPVRAADAMQPRSAVSSRPSFETTRGPEAPRRSTAPSQDIVIHTVEVRVAAPSPEAADPPLESRPDAPRPGAFDESIRYFLRKV